MTLLTWQETVLTPVQRSQLRRELLVTGRFHIIGLRSAMIGFALGAICILGGQAISGVPLDDAWVLLASAAIAAGLLVATLPLLGGFGGAQQYSLNGEGIRSVGGQRFPWALLRGYWTATSPVGYEELHLLTRPGRHVNIRLPSPSLARTLEALLRTYIPELPPSDRTILPPTLPTWLGLLSYATILFGGTAAGLIVFQIPDLGSYTTIAALGVVGLLLSFCMAIVWHRLYHLSRDLLVGIASAYFMGTTMVGAFTYAALLARTFQLAAAGA